jgi:hypothetical protein
VDAPVIQLDESVRGLGLEGLLVAWQGLSPTAGLLVAGLGLVYLLFGKWLFRILVAGLGLAVGLEAGQMLAGHFEVSGPWLPFGVAIAAGIAAWPLWQVLVFVLGGAALGLGVAELVHGVMGHAQYYLFAGIGGFVVGGLLAVLVLRVAAVVLTAMVGAWLTLTGLVAFGHGTVPLVAAVGEATWAALVVLGVLMAVGLAVQTMLPSAEDARRRSVEAAADRSKGDDEAEKRRRYAQYLGR